ncbi:MAG: S8/S53 family peptidase, partial [Phycisphaerales bacterium]
MLQGRQKTVLIIVWGLGLATAGSALESPKIDRRPEPPDWERGKLTNLPRHDPNSTNAFQVDLRSCDLSGLDLTGRLGDLFHASFDDRTQWPQAERMAEGFDPRRIMALGKNPGLGIRALHEQGITGRGVGIAILDQPLLVDHQEYADRLRLYEEINIPQGMPASMHGPAVASIAVGKTVGVAPEADLYYIGQFNGERVDGKLVWTFESLARGVNRVLEINEQLPPTGKIRVISISVGWDPSQKGYEQISEAAKKAKVAGMLVICSSVEDVHGFRFHGLGRGPLADPDDFTAYGPGSWWAKLFDEGRPKHTEPNRLLVPMDARTTACPTGVDEYVFYGEGGWSWSIPYIAGVYALAAQVEPKLTPDRFWALAVKAGRTIELHRGGKERKFGPIIDAGALMAGLRRGALADEDAVAAALAKYYPPATPKSPGADVSGAHVPKELAARIDKLEVGSATRQDAITLFGEPFSYVLGDERLDAGSLPSHFAMIYPGDVQVIVSDDRVQRITIMTPGYRFQDTIQVGTSMEEVFNVLGPPRRTIDGADYADIRSVTDDNILFDKLVGVAGTAF